MRFAIFALVCVSPFSATAAYAQSCHHKAAPVRRAVWVPVYRPHYHASTVAESYARGRADLVRAHGQFNLLNSRARLNHSKAARREIENDVVGTQAYFDKKVINHSYRYGERSNRAPRVVRVSHAVPVDREAVLGKLLRDGCVAWPAALSGPAFADHRATVDQIMLIQTATGLASPSDRVTLEELSRAMTCLLKEHVHQCHPQDFVDAKLFLKALSEFASA